MENLVASKTGHESQDDFRNYEELIHMTTELIVNEEFLSPTSEAQKFENMF